MLQGPDGVPLSGEELALGICIFGALGEVILSIGLAYYLRNSSVEFERYVVVACHIIPTS